MTIFGGTHVVATQSLLLKAGGVVALSASFEALASAAATIIVGFLAAISAIVVAFIQNNHNKARDLAIEQVVALTNKITEMEHERAEELAAELEKARKVASGNDE